MDASGSTGFAELVDNHSRPRTRPGTLLKAEVV